MTEQHPITPPPELVEQWRDLPEFTDGRRKMIMVTLSREKLLDIATQAARWGADQELLACGKYLERCAAWEEEDVTEMYNYRRPKLLSLKEQALEAMDRCDNEIWCEETEHDLAIIRRALEQLND